MEAMPQPGTGPSAAAEEVCGLLLELAGRSPGRMLTARRHARILDAAVPHMSLPQREEAQRRIRLLETRWGPLLPGHSDLTENDGIEPETRVAVWLSRRRTSERLLRVLLRAADRFYNGVTCLSEVMDYAFARETDYVLYPVGFDSFKEWMIELRIAKSAGTGTYVPGELCRWWVEQMMLSKEKSSAYQRSLEQSQQIRLKRRLRY